MLFFLHSIQFVFCMLGVFVPGYLASRTLASREAAVSSFVSAVLILFHSIFWLGVAGVHIGIGSVVLVLSAITVMLAALLRRRRVSFRAPVSVHPPAAVVRNRLLLGMAGTAFLLFSLRALAQPLSGWDTFFRWERLAAVMLQLGNFEFYPPLTAADFRIYGYPDGIPPLVSFCYFWSYAGFAGANPQVASVWVLLQFALILLLVYRIGRLLFGETAAMYAAVVTATAPLLFWAVLMGQETGLTALSLLATVYFLLDARDPHDWRSGALAGCAAAVGALSREYGWAVVICGVVLCGQRRLSVKTTIVFAATACVWAAPWYVRNWLLTGSPFYSIAVGDLLPVNAVHTAIMRAQAPSLGIERNTTQLFHLLEYAPLPIVLGIAGCVVFVKRQPAIIFSVAFVVALWLYSMGSTSGGPLYSMRVLSPAFALLAVLGGGVLGEATGRRPPRLLRAVALAVCFYGIAACLVVPGSLRHTPVGAWMDQGFATFPHPAAQLAKAVQPVVANARILSDDAYVHAAMSASGIGVVPVWSPEAAFLFEPMADLKSSLPLLRDRDIKFVMRGVGSLNNLYLDTVPFFRQVPSVLWKAAEGGGYVLYQVPD